MKGKYDGSRWMGVEKVMKEMWVMNGGDAYSKFKRGVIMSVVNGKA